MEPVVRKYMAVMTPSLIPFSKRILETFPDSLDAKLSAALHAHGTSSWLIGVIRVTPEHVHHLFIKTLRIARRVFIFLIVSHLANSGYNG